MKTLVILSLLLTGCEMTVYDQIRDIKICEKAGMDSKTNYSNGGYMRGVSCIPREKKPIEKY